VARVGAARLGLVLVTVLSVLAHAQEEEGDPARVITYADDKLTVRLVDVPVREVLDEVGRQSGAEIRGGVVNGRNVSTEFDRVPLSEALHRLLGDQNFALLYGERGRLRAIKLLGGPQAPPPAVKTAAATPPTTATARPRENMGHLLAMVATHAPVPVHGRLSQTLGTDAASLTQILETGTQHEDPIVRGEALRAGLQVLETDPQLRSTFMSTLKGVDDAELATYLRSAMGPRAEEIVQQIMTQSRGSDIRIKASGVLQQLRKPPSGG
jgi:hypothetical protein